MLGGVPRADVRELRNTLAATRNQVDRIHDVLNNTIFVVKKEKAREIWCLSELVDFVIKASRTHGTFEAALKNMNVEQVDTNAAEILYGVKRRFKD